MEAERQLRAWEQNQRTKKHVREAIRTFFKRGYARYRGTEITDRRMLAQFFGSHAEIIHSLEERYSRNRVYFDSISSHFAWNSPAVSSVGA